MPFAVIKLPEEPIVIVSVALPIERHLSSLYSIWVQIDRLAREERGPLYEIVDVRNQDVSFSDILVALDELDDHPPGSIADPRIRTVLVGDHPMLAIAVKKLWQRFSLEIPVFATLDAALDYVRGELNR